MATIVESFVIHRNLSTFYVVGGYCKEYAKGKRPIGIMLEDTWFLRYVLAVTSKYVITSYSPSQTDC
jgi:hypothetical protein